MPPKVFLLRGRQEVRVGDEKRRWQQEVEAGATRQGMQKLNVPGTEKSYRELLLDPLEGISLTDTLNLVHETHFGYLTCRTGR